MQICYRPLLLILLIGCLIMQQTSLYAQTPSVESTPTPELPTPGQLHNLYLPLINSSENSATPATEEGNTILEGTIITPTTAIPTDQVIIRFKSEVQAAAVDRVAQVAALSAVAGVELVYEREMSDEAIVAKLPTVMMEDEVRKITDAIQTLPEIDYAEPDAIMQPLRIPNDPYYGYQWHYFAPATGSYGVNLPAAWEITTGAASIVVAVIDTGILNHPDLAGRIVPGYDFINNEAVANDGDKRDNNPTDSGNWVTTTDINTIQRCAGQTVKDSSWHGTHVAGTIAANSNNGLGVTGINWQAKILPVRAMGKCGGYTSDVADGIRWAAGLSVIGVPANANRARVINLSLGAPTTTGCEQTYQTAINAAVNAGSVVVVSAGNSNANAANFQPANCANVITVGATDRNGNRAANNNKPYSNYGATVEISAPGGDTTNPIDGSNGILSTWNTGKTVPAVNNYAYNQGTSMAAPHVSGVVSLMLSVNPNLTTAQVTTILQKTATAFPGGCSLGVCGAGIVNAAAAVQPPKAQPDPFNKTYPGNNATNVPVSINLTWEPSPGAVYYLLCVDTTADLLCNGSGDNTNFTRVDRTSYVINLAPNIIYSWQVRAVGTGGLWTPGNGSGQWWSFTTGNYPAAFNKTYPGNNATGIPTNINLTWNASAGASYYLLCIDTTADLYCNGATDNTNFIRVNGTSYAVNLAAGTTYSWQVRAIGANGNPTPGNGSGQWWTFRTR